jgi:uncharacterized protein (TIGR03067 family)
MRFMLCGVGLVLVLPVLGDDAKEELKNLEGTWAQVMVTNGKSSSVGSPTKDSPKLTIKGEEAEWTEIDHFGKAGKGKFKVDASRTPHTIELNQGDKTRKGVYAILDKGKSLRIFFSEPGEDFPKELPKGVSLPKGAKGVLIWLSAWKE